MTILEGKQINSNLSKSEIIYKPYLYLYKRMNDIILNCYCFIAIQETIWLFVKEKRSGSVKNVIYNFRIQIIYIWYICLNSK